VFEGIKERLKARLSPGLKSWLAGWRARGERLGQAVINVGGRYHCPVCGWGFRRFLPAGLDLPLFREHKVVGAGPRPNATCPLCRSSDRERHLFLFLKHATPLFRDRLKVLHVGPEHNLCRILGGLRNLDYLSADLCSPRAKMRLDVTQIPYRDGTFDVILCNHVLEHVPDDRRALAELFRVLRPGGWAVLQVPLCLSIDYTYEDPSVTTGEERERLFGQHDHVRLYAADYKDRLESAGFQVELWRWQVDFDDETGHDYCLIPDEDLYVCSRSPFRAATPRKERTGHGSAVVLPDGGRS
jgi:SAM-dependent methyltransferase